MSNTNINQPKYQIKNNFHQHFCFKFDNFNLYTVHVYLKLYVLNRYIL